MKRVILAIGVVAAACGPSDPLAQKELFGDQISTHFFALNEEVALTRQAFMGQRDAAETSRGLTFNTYHYDPDGFFIVDVKCPNCALKQDILSYAPDAPMRRPGPNTPASNAPTASASKR